MENNNKQKLQKLTFSCSIELQEKLKQLSEKTDIPYSRLIRKGIKLVLAQYNHIYIV